MRRHRRGDPNVSKALPLLSTFPFAPPRQLACLKPSRSAPSATSPPTRRACKVKVGVAPRHPESRQGYRRRHTLGPDLAVVGWLAGVQICTCDMLCSACMIFARASAPWKIFCFLLKFLLKQCYKCRVGSNKSESREVGLFVWRQIRKRRSGPNVLYDI